ncbi:type II toxin-antitoxin system VapC family toxin [Paracraurococcus lichenis]|uniref:Type II toxin-antitoxin system VapC family toxin n=1 Tax=Paracraurococcus lichenis TaxID=3064888 RepID=A0ABT9E9B6_9PROT|nr:type II toxin-antitoxin system VapC family toxin [Paracraurococcus sp. LOR1-02]MDO9712530.1 type II toxin-antitoxin system VapC family toxin [Paracraurococcus sp. LOR1-02]
MSLCVLDASATFPWLFEDEASLVADALLDHVTEHGAVVPALWFLECTNGLAMAERRGRIDGAGIVKAIALLRRLPLILDNEAPSRALDTVLDLARTHRLTTYDAGYLDLALRRGLPLATDDAPLRAAATTAGVVLLTVTP